MHAALEVASVHEANRRGLTGHASLLLQEGSQFCRGFGGIGGLLRYSVDLSQFEAADEEDGPEWDSDEDI